MDRLIELYKIRFDYVHGSIKSINNDNLLELREMVRIVLILYWAHTAFIKDKSKTVLYYIENSIDFSFNVSKFAEYFYVDNYENMYYNSILDIAAGIRSGKYRVKRVENGVIKEIEEVNTM